MVIAALAAAAVAAFSIIAYLGTVREDVHKGKKTVRVYVAVRRVPKGTTGAAAIDDGSIKLQERVVAELPDNALRTPEDRNGIAGKQAIIDIERGEVVVDGKFVDPELTVSAAVNEIPSGQVAVSVSVDQVRGVGGNLQPGDRVNIVVSGQDNVNPEYKFTQVLYQDVHILRIGTQSAPRPGDQAADPAAAANSGLITFAVPPDAASRIIHVTSATDGATLYLTLLPKNYEPAPIDDIDVNNWYREIHPDENLGIPDRPEVIEPTAPPAPERLPDTRRRELTPYKANQ